MMPSAFGLLAPSLLDSAQISPQLLVLGTCLAIALALGAVLWPALMITTGLALPARLARARMSAR
jgi:hypothetical protein